MDNKVCLVTGVGEGTGAAIVRHFAQAGYKVAMVARDASRLREYEGSQPGTMAYPCDVGDLQALKETLDRIRSDLGAPSVLIHNAVRATFGKLLDTELEELEKNFRVNTTSLAMLAREFIPDMLSGGGGSIVATGNTAAYRGVPGFALFAPSKAAQRVFLEAVARDFGPQGIHAAYVNIDAVIDVPWTRSRVPDDTPESFFISPGSIAAEVFHTAHQPRDAWSFNVEIRPYAETW